MRRFSQRSSLVTLSEINITPLLDLAFVLLIIFVITTPLLEQSLPMKLPTGGAPRQKVDPRDVRTVEIASRGNQPVFKLGRVPMTLDQIESTLSADYQQNPNLVVVIRADELDFWRDVAAVMDRCRRHGITRMDCSTEPPKR